MRETFDDKRGISCAEAAILLEKRFAEEALSKQTAQNLLAHLAACRQCGRLEDWMSSLRVQADAHGEKRFNTRVRAAYQTLVEKKAEAQNRERRIKIAIAIVAAVLLLAVLFGRSRTPVGNSKAENEAIVAVDCRPASPDEFAPGVLITHCDHEVIEKLIENDGEVRVRLTSGTVGLLIDPDRPHKRKVVVETPQGEVRVKGTLFTVQVEAGRSLLEVFRGVVEFYPTATAEQVLSVKAGQGADLELNTIFSLDSPTGASIKQVLLDARVRSPMERSSALQNTVAESNAQAPEVSLDGRKTTASTQPFVARPKTASPPKREVPGIDLLIHEAQDCLIARDWACASARYEALLRHYPNSPESTAALVSLARIELSHLSRPTQALAHLKTYQERAPNGPMAEEALFSIAAACRRLGKKDSEQATLREFIEKYPNSSQVRRARTRLRQLEPEK